MQASFLDPRFKNLQGDDDVAVIRAALKRLSDVEPDTSESSIVKKEKEQPSPAANKQKGN